MKETIDKEIEVENIATDIHLDIIIEEGLHLCLQKVIEEDEEIN